MKFIVFLVAIFLFRGASAQAQKNAILANFDSIAYYPDSTIESAYKVRKGKAHGYAIEFDSLGRPVAIGKYVKGEKDGGWLLRNGWMDFYENGTYDGFAIPGCGTGLRIAKEEFENLYRKLIEEKSPRPLLPRSGTK